MVGTDLGVNSNEHWRSLLRSCATEKHRVGRRLVYEGIYNLNAIPRLCDLLEVEPSLCYAQCPMSPSCILQSIIVVLEDAAERASLDIYFFDSVKRGLHSFVGALLERHLVDAQQLFYTVVLPFLRRDNPYQKSLVLWSMCLYECILKHFCSSSIPPALPLLMRLSLMQITGAPDALRL